MRPTSAGLGPRPTSAGPQASRELESHRERCLPSARSSPTLLSLLQRGSGSSRSVNAATIFSGKLPPASDKPARWATEVRIAPAEAVFFNERARKAAGQSHAKGRARALTKVPSVPRLTEHSVRCAALAAEKRYQLPPAPLDEEERQINEIAHTALASAWRQWARLELRRREEERQAMERTVYGARDSVEGRAHQRLPVEMQQRAHAEVGRGASDARVAGASFTASDPGRVQSTSLGPSSPPQNAMLSAAGATGADLASRQLLAAIHGVTSAAAGAAFVSMPSPLPASSKSPGAGGSMRSLRSSPSRVMPDPFDNPKILKLVRKPSLKLVSHAARAAIEAAAREHGDRLRAREAARADPRTAERKRAEVARWKSERTAAAERELIRRAEADESTWREEAVARAARAALRNAPPTTGQRVLIV
jgi:hypothetical protein